MGCILNVPERRVSPEEDEALGPGAFDDAGDLDEEIIDRIRGSAGTKVLTLDRPEHSVTGEVAAEGPKVVTQMLEDIPKQVFRVTKLENLSVSRHALSSIPPDVARLSRLRVLDVESNHLEALPEELGACVALEELLISDNRIKELPASIGRCTKLRRLICFQNQLSELPASLADCTDLRELNFFSNVILRLPEEFEGLVKLEDVNFGGNKLKRMVNPTRWTECTRLALHWNQIVVCPTIENMPCLRQLQLAGNPLETLPIGEGLPLLELLDASRLHITALPPAIGTLGSLRTLTLSSCKLEALPPEIGGCTMLDTLNVASNRLVTLPAELALCEDLSVILARGNRIRTLHPDLSALGHLKRVDLGNNSLNDDDADTDAVLRVFYAVTMDHGGTLDL